jgi:predicted acylesterase/phospholipase RssA
MTQMASPSANPASPNTTSQFADGAIAGTKDKEIFALSFGPGAFDTIVQLGVTHALLVSRRRPPDVVLGLSAGAANAVALGEVFSEPGGVNGQVGRFRDILNAARSSLRVFKHELSPDPLELNTENALSPMELAIHHREERAQRKGALRSVIGILRLFNDIMKLQVTLHVIVQLTQRILCVKESLAFTDPNRYRSETTKSFFHLAMFVFLYQWRFILPIGRAVWRVMAVHLQSSLEWNIKPIQHFLSLRRRLISLGLKKAIVLLSLIPASFVFTHWIQPLFSQIPSSHLFSGGIILILAIMIIVPVIVLGIGGCLVLRGPSKALPEPTPSKWHSKFLLPLLKAYDLHDQLFTPYVLEQFLIDTFNRHYYGHFNIREAVKTAIKQDNSSANHDPPQRISFEKYLRSPFPIHIAIAGAKLSTGQTVIFEKTTSIIEAMLASMAFPPFFKPKKIDGSQFIDPACIGEEPVAPLMEYLRNHADPTTKKAYVFHVTPFPAQKPVEQRDSFTSLTTITMRSLELLRSRRVSLEQRLTKQYSKLLPTDAAVHSIKGTKFVSATLFPIDTEYPLGVTERFLTALSNEEQESTVLHAVATGCRTTLQRILAPESASLRLPTSLSKAQSHHEKNPLSYLKCRALLTELELKPEEFPGNDLSNGPGLREICDYCTLLPLLEIDKADKATQRQVLRPISVDTGQPLWPTMPPFKTSETTLTSAEPHPSLPTGTIRPLTPHSPPIEDRPWITSIWSGGVFRGVFQIGAINGYNESGVKPRIFAGTSVGSIMAALAARVTSLPEHESKVAIQKAAATFIGLDRLILTDRFADLVRRLAIRANDIHLTPKIIDQVFRQFDLQTSDRFNRSIRQVAAGFERLLYMSPFELLKLTKALHNTDGPAAVKLLGDAIDYLFERSGAGLELLGAEPMQMLIAEHVLEGIDTDAQRTLTVGQYLEGLPWLNGLKNLSYKPRPYLLISTTDLTNGTLDVIGSDSLDIPHDVARIKRGSDALLVEALLAGSAFPAVFRPRRRSEVYPTAHKGSVLVDGGIMDNLPLDPVVRFMKNASETGARLLRRRPSNPHLILTASLERRVNDIPINSARLNIFDNDWRTLTRRVTELQYNRKVMVFTKAQRHFRFIYNNTPQNDANQPLDYVVGTVKPEWLCGTFAFHSMLGFSQVKQAGSIAHGCAMTLATLSQLAERPDGSQWGIQMGSIEPNGFCSAPTVQLEEEQFLDETVAPDRIANTKYLDTLYSEKRSAKVSHGHCWFRKDAVCPFSAQGLKKWDGKFPEATQNALKMIHDLCGQASTHKRQTE